MCLSSVFRFDSNTRLVFKNYHPYLPQTPLVSPLSLFCSLRILCLHLTFCIYYLFLGFIPYLYYMGFCLFACLVFSKLILVELCVFLFIFFRFYFDRDMILLFVLYRLKWFFFIWKVWKLKSKKIKRTIFFFLGWIYIVINQNEQYST